MDRSDRWHRIAAWTLGAVGVLLLIGGLLAVVQVLPDLLGARGAYMADLGAAGVVLVIVPIVAGGSLAMGAAWLLRRSDPRGVALAILWVVIASLVCLVTLSGWGNSLAVLRMYILESSGVWTLSWPELGVLSADGVMYYAQIDEPTFWLPAIVALGAVVVVGCLVGSAVARRQGSPRGVTNGPV